MSSKWSANSFHVAFVDALVIDHLVGGSQQGALDRRPHRGSGALRYGMELLDGETGLLADPGVLAPLVRRARAPCHPENDQLAEPRVECRLLHEGLVERHPSLGEREVMGQEAEHLRHRQRVGARQVELRPTEVGGQYGSGRVVPLLDRERGQPGHSTDPPLTPRTWPVM